MYMTPFPFLCHPLLGKTHRPDKWDKRILVWDGRYASADEVPHEVNPEMMERAKSRVRIKINIAAMLATAVACFLLIYRTKGYADSETVEAKNKEKHAQWSGDESKGKQ